MAANCTVGLKFQYCVVLHMAERLYTMGAQATMKYSKIIDTKYVVMYNGDGYESFLHIETKPFFKLKPVNFDFATIFTTKFEAKNMAEVWGKGTVLPCHTTKSVNTKDKQ